MEPTATVVSRKSSSPPPPEQADPRAAKILARSLFKDLVAHGMSSDQIIAVASELIAHVTQELKQAHPDTTPPGRA
jgi:hypothetical protein